MPRSARSTIACPRAWQVEPGSIVVAPLGPRQLLGVVWEPERLPDRGGRRQPPAAARRRARRAAARRAAAPAVRVDRGLLSRPLASVLRMALPSSAALEGAAPAHRISRDRPRPRAADPAARAGARADRRPPGPGPRARRSCRRLRRRDPRAGQGRRDRGGRGRRRRPFPCPDPDHAPPALDADQREAAASLSRGDRQGLRPGPARRRHRLGQDRGLFRGHRRGLRRAGRRSSCSPKSR